jgi:hypothetical protein
MAVTDRNIEACQSVQGRDGAKMSNPSVVSTVHKLALVGERAGFTLEQMIEMLNAGITVEALLLLIESQLVSQQRQETAAQTHSPQYLT